MTKFSSPVPKGAYMTSKYGPRGGTIHAGTDWAGPVAGEPTDMHAIADGTVAAAGVGVLTGHTGKIVVLDHGTLTDKYGADRTLTNYGHMSRIDVAPGERVTAGQVIGRTGKTGNATGVHAHIGVRFNGKYSDPARWLKNKGVVPGQTAPLKAAAKPKPVPAAPKGKTYRNLSKRNKSRGADVRAVSAALRRQGYKWQKDTSTFTAQLDVNVRDFQRRTGLWEDGVAGKITQQRLGL